MNIISDESSFEQYAIISYSRKDREAIKSELNTFDTKGICYWIDDSIARGENWETRFFNILDNKNCKGIIFFVSNPYLLSEQCAKEMMYFKEKYGVGNSDKFCLFVLPDGYPRNDKNKIKNEVLKYADDKTDEKTINGLNNLDSHIDLFLELNQKGKAIGGKIGNADNYIDLCCKEGDLFYKYGILYGHKKIENAEFGYFPQVQEYNDIYEEVERSIDKKLTYYAPIDWFVIKDVDKEQTLLSKKLLFAIDYLNLRYPLNKNNKTVEEWIKNKFEEYFKLGEYKGKIKIVRFLLEEEFKALLRRKDNDINKKRELLLPEVTYFAQISTGKNVYPFWLAGNINDARRVDAATESLSDLPVGIELYYVRIVIEIEK